MASDLSSGCTETIEILDGKEEGEISLEDVSSSEESHPACAYRNRISQCPACMSTQYCASWCTAPTRLIHDRNYNNRDAVHGKENRRRLKESTPLGVKYSSSKLQEKNDDLVPISSDSDMEIVGFIERPSQLLLHNLSKARKKRKRRKRTSSGSTFNVDDAVISGPSIDIAVADKWSSLNGNVSKEVSKSRSRHKEGNSVHRSCRSRVAMKSPIRHKSPNKGRLSPRRSRSPKTRPRSPLRRSPLRRSPLVKRSPRRGRSPKRSMRECRKLSKLDSNPRTVSDIEVYNNIAKLLKKTKQAENVSLGSAVKKTKENASSLKEKLSHLLNKGSDNNGNTTNFSKENASAPISNNHNIDDEDDIAVLRQKALETKQNKIHKSNEESKVSAKSEAASMNSQINSDKLDIEDLELRMAALRSAIIKKYQNKAKKGVKSGKKTANRSESPFTQSFLDNIPIPTEGEEYYTSPCTPPLTIGNVQTEDMELDTDVEREKEKLPYSPTDKITTSVPIDSDLLRVKSSDVSFINLNETNNAQSIDPVEYLQEDQTLKDNICKTNSYMQYVDSCDNVSQAIEPSYGNTPYSPSDPIEASKPDFLSVPGSISCIPISKLLANTCDDKMYERSASQSPKVHSNDDVPYSPSDVLNYDLESSFQSNLVADENENQAFLESVERARLNLKASFDLSESQGEDAIRSQNSTTEDCNDVSGKSGSISRASSLNGSFSPNGSLVTIDDLPETDVDESSIAAIVTDTPNIPNEIRRLPSKRFTEEPLYMLGVSDITKDENKIPTLINRSLVPALILKSNKHLQQPLPKEGRKKRQVQPEPTFKNAEMLPVEIDSEPVSRPNTSFKPIKLSSFVKPVAKLATTPVAFNVATSDESAKEENQPEVIQFQENETTMLTQPITEYLITNDTKKEVIRESAISSKSSKSLSEPISLRKKTKRGTRGGNKVRLTKKQATSSKLKNLLSKDTQKDNRRNKSSSRYSPNRSRKSTRDKELLSSERRSRNSRSLEHNRSSTYDTHGSQKKQRSSSVSKTIVNTAKSRNSDINFVNSKESSKTAEYSVDNEKSKEGIVDNKKKNIVEESKISNSGSTTYEADKRRHSLDEDEDELRAKLLASLAKRAKTSETSLDSTNANTAKTVAASTNLESTKSVPTVVVPSLNTNQTSLASSNNSTALPSPVTGSNVEDKEAKQELEVSNVPLNKTSKVEQLQQAALVGEKRKSTTILNNPLNKLVKKDHVNTNAKATNQINLNAQNSTIVNQKNLNAQNSTIVNQKNLNLQNSTIINQKNLNVQNNSMLHANQPIDSKSISNVKTTENKWSTSLKTLKLPDTQRLVINLNSDSESDSEAELNKRSSNPGDAEKRTSNSGTPIDFEKSVDQFLRDVRKKQESLTASTPPPTGSPVARKKSVTNATVESKKTTAMHTPLAVRHLPASQQEEYRRLKQQIVEREKLKMQKLINNTATTKLKAPTVSNPSSTTASISSSSLSSKQNDNILVKITNEKALTSQSLNTKTNANVDNSTKTGQSTFVNPKAATKPMSNLSIQIQNEFVSRKSNASRRIIDKGTDDTTKAENEIPMVQSRPSFGLQTLIKDSINFKTNKVQEKPSLSSHVTQPGTSPVNITLHSNQIVVNGDNFAKRIQGDAVVNINEKNDGNLTNNNTTIDSNASTFIIQSSCEIINSVDSSEDTEDSTMVLSNSSKNDSISLSNIKGVDADNAKQNLNGNVNKASIKQGWDTIKKQVETELESLSDLPKEKLQQHLTETEQNLVKRRYTVLDELAELSGTLRQWYIERDLQTGLVEDVKKLREQLRIAEEKLQEQKNRINTMGPKVVVAHAKVHRGRKECYHLATICSELGQQVKGTDYQLPEAGANLLDSRFREVKAHIRQLSKKRIPAVRPTDSNSSTSSQNPSNIAKEANTMEMDGQLKNACNINPEVSDECAKAVDLSNCFSLDLSAMSLDTSLVETDERRKTIVEKTVVQTAADESMVEITTAGETMAETVIPRENEKLVLEEETSPASGKECSEIEEIARPSETTSSSLKITNCDAPISNKKIIAPYISILTHMKEPRNTNPNGILCPYELGGTCSDKDCQFVHHSKGLV
ncbi:serine-rich adhesin for platelets-like [Prorops nasuta]|uniref:serine-rich adhesin for platelets-like n=1 Tax=Prorops nasuta TaxID=863751 RepID=UPI0034CEB8C5